jgi:GNAT superfamily N-acetyltransferase
MTQLSTVLPASCGEEAHSDGITIRPPSPDDVAALARLFSEMQYHYGRPVSHATATAAATLACRPPVGTFDPHTLLAVMGTEIVGSLVLNVTFPAFELTRSLYIRDLYITRTMRRHGVGQALVKAATRLALAEGFAAIEWTTDTGNTAARAMYEACGAMRLDRTYYRLFDDALRRGAR